MRCARAISSSTEGSMRLTISATPFAGRMHAVVLVELGVEHDAVEEEGIEDEPVGCAQASGKTASKSSEYVSPQFAGERMPASRIGMLRCFKLAMIFSRLARVTLGSMPRKRVVGAELDDDGVGVVRHRPGQPLEAAGGGVAGDAGIGRPRHYGRASSAPSAVARGMTGSDLSP